MRTVIELASLLLVGWIAGAELGSWGCVQPVVARLPYEQYVAAEKGMLRTFGRVMPVFQTMGYGTACGSASWISSACGG